MSRGSTYGNETARIFEASGIRRSPFTASEIVMRPPPASGESRRLKTPHRGLLGCGLRQDYGSEREQWQFLEADRLRRFAQGRLAAQETLTAKTGAETHRASHWP